MKTRRWIVGERGQTLIIVAVALTVLLMFVALAIDVGNMYQSRRQMQNAADAGALAGARELCLGNPQSVAEQRAREYARLNGAEDVQVSFLDGGWTVEVVARMPDDMYVADIMGVPTVDVGAEAAAICGAAVGACGLWPVAIEGADYLWFFENGGCGNSFLIWNGDQNPPDCSKWNCNTSYGRMLDGESRAWLDFTTVFDPSYPYPDTHCGKSGSGCGADELKDCLRYDSEARLKPLPLCVPGDSGVKAGTQNAVESRIGDVVKVPLYNGRCAQNDCKEGFYIVGLGCFQVQGWIQKVTLDPLPSAPPGTKKWEDKAIRARMLCNDSRCITECGETSGSPPEPWSVRAVDLIK